MFLQTLNRMKSVAMKYLHLGRRDLILPLSQIIHYIDLKYFFIRRKKTHLCTHIHEQPVKNVSVFRNETIFILNPESYE